MIGVTAHALGNDYFHTAALFWTLFPWQRCHSTFFESVFCPLLVYALHRTVLYVWTYSTPPKYCKSLVDLDGMNSINRVHQGKVIIWLTLFIITFTGDPWLADSAESQAEHLHEGCSQTEIISACPVCTGEVWVCPAQRHPWCCDTGERFSCVGEEPAPRQTGEPRAGAQGEEAGCKGEGALAMLCCVHF